MGLNFCKCKRWLCQLMVRLNGWSCDWMCKYSNTFCYVLLVATFNINSREETWWNMNRFFDVILFMQELQIVKSVERWSQGGMSYQFSQGLVILAVWEYVIEIYIFCALKVKISKNSDRLSFNFFCKSRNFEKDCRIVLNMITNVNRKLKIGRGLERAGAD